jgi:CrcB protein
LTKYFLIGIFGVVGVFARYGMGLSLNRNAGFGFPVGTFVINLIGCFFIGVVYVLGVEREIISSEVRVALMAGLLGGFTTFSAYSLETAVLMKNQEYGQALLYFVLSGILGLACTFLGFSLTRMLVGVK